MVKANKSVEKERPLTYEFEPDVIKPQYVIEKYTKLLKVMLSLQLRSGRIRCGLHSFINLINLAGL